MLNAFLGALAVAVGVPAIMFALACYIGLIFWATSLTCWGEDDYGHWKYNLYGLLLGMLLMFIPVFISLLMCKG